METNDQPEIRFGYKENVNCWLCVGWSWLVGEICIECNPLGTMAKDNEDD